MFAQGGKPLLPLYQSIAGLPICPRTGSTAHPGVPCLCPSMLKNPASLATCGTGSSTHLSVACLRLYLASPRQHYIPGVDPPPPSDTTTAVFLFPLPSRRQNIFYIWLQLCPWRHLPPPGITAPPPRFTPSIFHTPHILAATPTNPLPWSDANQYTSPHYASLFP